MQRVSREVFCRRVWVVILYACLLLPAVLSLGCGGVEGLVAIESPQLCRSRKVAPIVGLSGSPLEFSLARLLDTDFRETARAKEYSVVVEYEAQALPLELLNAKQWRYRLSRPFATAGWADIVLYSGEREVLRLRKVLRLIERFRVTLTFDDGPGLNKAALAGDISKSPTLITLRKLDDFVHGPGGSERGIKAAFFILSTTDRFCSIVYPKGETAAGREIIAEVARRGNVIGVHAGGEYYSQANGHDKRVREPAYAVAGQPAGSFANALEADLYECVSTLRELTGRSPEFVRPPLWRYADSFHPEVAGLVAAAYARYGLKLILSDAKFPDGGYYLISIVALQKYRAYKGNLRRAFLSGEDNLVISMHDSNAYTANSLGDILKMIGEEFEKVDFAGVNGNGGERLDFADSYEEVRDNLRAKRRFVLFPEYVGGQEEQADE